MCVGRAVDRVDDGQQPGGAVTCHPRLLGQDLQACTVQDGEGRPVGGQVEPVLPRLLPARAPILQDVERATHGADRFVEHFQEANVVHGCRTLSAAVTPPAWPGRPVHGH